MTERQQTVLGFDYGTQRIGVASGQTLTKTASPVTTLTTLNGKPDWKRIEKLIEEWRPDALVVGMPYNMDGSRHAMTDAAEKFARQLHGRFGLPVHTIDERLSSIAAHERLRADGGQKSKIGSRIDEVAAVVIVETWLHHID